MIALVLAAMLALAPGRDHTELAGAVARVVESERPLFAGADGQRRTAALLVAVAFRESSLRNDAVGDGGRSVCAMQIYGGPRALLTDPEACVRRGLALLRDSMRWCPTAPVAIYAAGPNGCASETARRISRDRMALAAWLERTVGR